jgi:hypothetical protein
VAQARSIKKRTDISTSLSKEEKNAFYLAAGFEFSFAAIKKEHEKPEEAAVLYSETAFFFESCAKGFLEFRDKTRAGIA